MRFISFVLATTLTLIMSQIATSQAAMAADINVVSGGAFKQVLSALVAQYEKETGNKVAVTYQTVGQHLALIKDGKEEFDVAVLTPEAIDGLAKDGKVVPGTRADLAKVGVGVVVKSGAPLPDISTDEAFKRALLAAKSVAYIDPKAGGSSGIYVDGLLKRLGIADADPSQSGTGTGRGGCRSRRRWGSRNRRPPDQRDPAGCRCDLGRSAAGRHPELHHLCRGRRRDGQRRSSGQGLRPAFYRARTPCRSSRPRAWSRPPPRAWLFQIGSLASGRKKQRPADAGR